MSTTQRVQPESDSFVGDWDNQLADGVDLFGFISTPQLEDDPDPPTLFIDQTWIVTGHQPASAVYVTKLENFVNPGDLGEEWVLRFRASKMNNTGVSLDLTVELRDGYVDEVDQGDLIHSEFFGNIAFGFQDYEMTMSIPSDLTPDVTTPDINPSSINSADLHVRLIADLT